MTYYSTSDKVNYNLQYWFESFDNESGFNQMKASHSRAEHYMPEAVHQIERT